MPFYEYECTDCKFYVEALQKISDKPLKQCPSCKQQTLKKLVSAPVFRLKGGGWYETDFKSETEEKRNLAGREEAAESKGAEAKAEAGKETPKPEPAPSESKAAKPAKPAKAAAKAVAAGGKARPKAKPAAKPAPKARPKPKPAKKKARR
jgi:putative FmdB family regulatory protein